MSRSPLEWIESGFNLVVARCKLDRPGGGETAYITRRFATLEKIQATPHNKTYPRRSTWRVYYQAGVNNGQPTFHDSLEEAKLHVEARYALESD